MTLADIHSAMGAQAEQLATIAARLTETEQAAAAAKVAAETAQAEAVAAKADAAALRKDIEAARAETAAVKAEGIAAEGRLAASLGAIGIRPATAPAADAKEHAASPVAEKSHGARAVEALKLAR